MNKLLKIRLEGRVKVCLRLQELERQGTASYQEPKSESLVRIVGLLQGHRHVCQGGGWDGSVKHEEKITHKECAISSQLRIT